MDRKIGLLGGGQLGQMLCEAANPLGINVIILDAEASPAKQVNAKHDHLNGSFTDAEKIKELAKRVDIMTVEIEHVDTVVLEEIAENGVEVTGKDGKKEMKKVEVQPSWRTLRTIQDKYLQKSHLKKAGVPTAVSVEVTPGAESLRAVGETLGYPYMLKAKKDAYDGRGNYPVKSAADIEDALVALKGRDLYAEKWANFELEIAVMVVKTENDPTSGGKGTIAYPAVETIHEDSICKLVYCPARGVTRAVQREAQALARKAIGSFWGKGVFGVELFLMANGQLILNEVAPRPHNSGHYTIEACPTMSQYKSQLLSILGLMPAFPDSRIPTITPAAVMLNILGGATKTSHNKLMKSAIAIPIASLHMYGKESKPARKIGHVTVVGSSMLEALETINPLIAEVDSIRAERKGIDSKSRLEKRTNFDGRPIAITMGSDSDLPVLAAGLKLLDDFEVPYKVTITSAHRTPDEMSEFSKHARDAGHKVIIAAAGGAAHLPGMAAGHTSLPVIGVPVKGSVLDGMDSLLSIVQMPRGVPVATVGINNSTNAALLALRILSVYDEAIEEKLEKYITGNATQVVEKKDKIEDIGWATYLKGMGK